MFSLRLLLPFLFLFNILVTVDGIGSCPVGSYSQCTSYFIWCVSSVCTVIPPGWGSDPSGNIVLCPQDTYSPGGIDYCLPCPANSGTLGTNSNNLAQCKAKPGYYTPACVSNPDCNEVYFASFASTVPSAPNNIQGANAVCAVYGGVVASSAQVRNAWLIGADWCAWGIVSDSTTTVYSPIHTFARPDCGSSVQVAGAPSIYATGALCYGPKPANNPNVIQTGATQCQCIPNPVRALPCPVNTFSPYGDGTALAIQNNFSAAGACFPCQAPTEGIQSSTLGLTAQTICTCDHGFTYDSSYPLGSIVAAPFIPPQLGCTSGDSSFYLTTTYFATESLRFYAAPIAAYNPYWSAFNGNTFITYFDFVFSCGTADGFNYQCDMWNPHTNVRFISYLILSGPPVYPPVIGCWFDLADEETYTKGCQVYQDTTPAFPGELHGKSTKLR